MFYVFIHTDTEQKQPACALTNNRWSPKGETNMNSKKMQSNLMLLLTAFIWGVAFVAQSVGMDYVGPFTFNFLFHYLTKSTDNPQQPSTLPTVMRSLPPTLHRHPPHPYLTRKH